MDKEQSIIPMERIEQRILLVRGQKVMLDIDLAHLYRVTVSRFNEAVKRNKDRFPPDFMYQLNAEECEILRSQNAISSSSWGGRRYSPYVFTEQGVAMLSSVLKSKRAALVNIEIMRAFVRLRQLINANKNLAEKLEELEKKYNVHDVQIKQVFEAIRQLMAPEPKSRRRIGFRQSG